MEVVVIVNIMALRIYYIPKFIYLYNFNNNFFMNRFKIINIF